MGGEVPEALQAVTLKAMARARAKRYASVEAFAADIEAYQNGFATSAEDAGAVRQLILFIKRNKGVSAAVALFFVAAAAFTVKLAASERIAKMNERRAVAAAEKSRRQEAQTSLMLAETCLETGDVEGMESALLATPEDLRTPTWRYLEAKMDRCDREFISTGTTQWVGLENHPTDPNLFVALQSDGAFCTLNPVTGERTVLWTAECAGRKPVKFAVSADGTRTAVAFSSKNALEIEVFDLASGQKKGVSIQSKESLEIFELQVSQRSILLRFSLQSAEIARCLCWDFETGETLWEKSFFVGLRFTKSGREVFGVDLTHNYVRLEAQTGRELESPRRVLAFPDAGFPNSFFWGPNEMVLAKNSDKLLKAVIGGKSAELSLKGGDKMIALTVLPERGKFGALVKTGPNSLRLELRDWFFGDLSLAFPMRGRLPLSGDSFTAVRGNTNFIAVVLTDSRRRIRLFDLRKTPSLHGESISKNRPRMIWLGEGDQVLAVSKIDTEEGRKNSYVLEKMDYQARAGGSVSTALMKVHDKGGYDIYIAGRQANDWIVYGRDGRLSGAYLDPEGLGERWVYSTKAASNFAIHPTRDELFLGPMLVDLKTGKEIRSIDKQGWKGRDDRDLKRPQSQIAVWVGEDRVLEPVEPVTQSGEKSGAMQRGMLALWNVRTGGLDVSVDAPYVAVVAASPDGASVLEGGVDKRVRIRNGASLAIESESRVHDQPVSGVAWHPTKPLIASASSDGTLRIWNRRDWSLVEEFRTGDANPWDVQISPSGKRLLAMRFGSEVRVFEPKSFQD